MIIIYINTISKILLKRWKYPYNILRILKQIEKKRYLKNSIINISNFYLMLESLSMIWWFFINEVSNLIMKSIFKNSLWIFLSFLIEILTDIMWKCARKTNPMYTLMMSSKDYVYITLSKLTLINFQKQ